MIKASRCRSVFSDKEIIDLMKTVKNSEFNGLFIRYVEKDNQLFVVFSDICKAIGISNPNASSKSISNNEKSYIDIGLKNSLAVCVSEAGITSFLMRSKKACAESFLGWIQEKVFCRKRG